MCYHIFEVLLPYEFLLEQNKGGNLFMDINVLLPYEFLLEQNKNDKTYAKYLVLLPYEFLLEQNICKRLLSGC